LNCPFCEKTLNWDTLVKIYPEKSDSIKTAFRNMAKTKILVE